MEEHCQIYCRAVTDSAGRWLAEFVSISQQAEQEVSQQAKQRVKCTLACRMKLQ